MALKAPTGCAEEQSGMLESKSLEIDALAYEAPSSSVVLSAFLHFLCP